MRTSLLWLAAACAPPTVSATSVKFRQANAVVNNEASSAPKNPYRILAAADSNDVDLTSTRDLIYIADVSVSGQDYAVQLDTGSSDLWIHTNNGVPGVTTTGLTYNLTYGIGFSFGNIVTANVEFAGFSIQRQAFVDARQAVNPILQLGAVGLLGLGFTGLSGVDSAVNATGDSYGRSLLWNVFAQDPSVPNFVSFVLSRNNDPQAPVEGSFTISEFDPDYTAVQKSPQVPTFPVNSPTRWTVLLDAFAANGKKFSVATTVSGVAKGKAVVLLDSGTTFTYAPESVVTAIYGKLPNATFDDSLSQWVLPCDTEVNVALYFAGQQYDLHPLDMVVPSTNNPKICVSSFIPQNLPVAQGQFDWLIGVNVLRSFYTVYDFGDPISGSQAVHPYVQVLQLKSAADASTDFHQVRGGVANNGTVNTAPTDGGTTSAGSGTSSSGSGSGSGSDSSPTLFDGSISSSLAKLLNYMPAIAGILGLNLLVLAILVIIGLVFLQRRRSANKKRRSPQNSALQLGLPTAHYRPVSTLDRDSVVQRQSTFDTLAPRRQSTFDSARKSMSSLLQDGGAGPSSPMSDGFPGNRATLVEPLASPVPLTIRPPSMAPSVSVRAPSPAPRAVSPSPPSVRAVSPSGVPLPPSIRAPSPAADPEPLVPLTPPTPRRSSLRPAPRASQLGPPAPSYDSTTY